MYAIENNINLCLRYSCRSVDEQSLIVSLRLQKWLANVNSATVSLEDLLWQNLVTLSVGIQWHDTLS